MSKQLCPTSRDLYRKHQLLKWDVEVAWSEMDASWKKCVGITAFHKLRDEYNKRKRIAERFEDKHFESIQRHIKFIHRETDRLHQEEVLK